MKTKHSQRRGIHANTVGSPGGDSLAYVIPSLQETSSQSTSLDGSGCAPGVCVPSGRITIARRGWGSKSLSSRHGNFVSGVVEFPGVKTPEKTIGCEALVSTSSGAGVDVKKASPSPPRPETHRGNKEFTLARLKELQERELENFLERARKKSLHRGLMNARVVLKGEWV